MSNDIREFHPGMGQAVAERTILRKKKNGQWESWADVSKRVSLGNSLLCKDEDSQKKEYKKLQSHIGKATILMSGRNLQHGDKDCPSKNMEIFTNCASSSTSFTMFYLLMNGSGVGRAYDDDLMVVNWDHAPNLRCVISDDHPDYDHSAHESVRDAKHKYGSGKDVLWFEVGDTREGWAKALEMWENAAFEKIHKDKLLILDFSKVRPKGAPIKGMQGRPASGPVPLMNAFMKAATLKGAGLRPWMQAMYVDHYFAECVLVGGARRSARMSTKTWRDESVLDFITIKRPIEYENKKVEEIIEIRKESVNFGFLWSSNNSITVDDEFWNLLSLKRGTEEHKSPLAKHARKVFRTATAAAYADGTGEPGFINQHKLVHNDEGLDDLLKGDYIKSEKYQVEEDTLLLLAKLAKKLKKKKKYMITNPCGEICLNFLGGFCVIADVAPYFADDLDEAEDAFRAATRALMRVNTMNSIYDKEVKRTNRIGVGMTGLHEFAWKFFGYGFRDLIDEEKSKDFWNILSRFARAVTDEASKYSKELGAVFPHTLRTIKPAGTTSKLFGLTEGVHLPNMQWYLRWVQFHKDDPLVEEYKNNNYPCRTLEQYKDTVIIGFPTEPVIAGLGLGDKFVTASEATPEEQYQWIMLLEKYWIVGTDKEGNLLEKDTGNQISYTLKYNPDKVSYDDFSKSIMNNQSKVKCCSVMPMSDTNSYEYTPEQSITKAEYEDIYKKIRKSITEDIGKEHIDCDSGACPVDFKDKK